MADRDDVLAIKRALSDPTRVLEALGMMGQGKARARQAGGWMVRCVMHEDGGPSCSVQQRHGVLLWKCHGCGQSGDVLHLVAIANNLSLNTDFKAVLAAAARLGGLWHLVDKLEGREPRAYVPPAVVPQTPPQAPQDPPREWPLRDEVRALWDACTPTADEPLVAQYLRGRALDPDLIDGRELARAIPPKGALPRWAVCHGGTWRETGYRLVLAMYDVTGEMRAVRAVRVIDGEGPKRRPPFGHKASELVMADAFGVAMLRAERRPYRLAIVEGEPDFLSRAAISKDAHGATIGIVSGSWTRAFADRVPVGCRVAIRTDNDEAGDRYAAEIESTLRRRAFLWRLQA